jgi:hypothetical protein
MTATILGAQSPQEVLRIQRPEHLSRQYDRLVPPLDLERESAFLRRNGGPVAFAAPTGRSRTPLTSREAALSRRWTPAAALVPYGLGTGGGDIFEVEPNDVVAQGVALPVNIFGGMGVERDADFFSFTALAGEQVTVEAFAARFRGSQLIPDLALFDADGNLLARDVGDVDNDPVVRFTPLQEQVLVAGITDIDDLGGSSFDYLVNITRGIDVDEDEPNDTSSQTLAAVPTTIFGEIRKRSDVDFYGFVAAAGQTLIVDLDAEVLGSRLDAEINLSDPETGTEYFYSDQYDGDDPRFNIVLPYTGRYVVGVGAFNSDSKGFYRMNLSLVPEADAPMITSVTRLSKKWIEIVGSGFIEGCRVEVNGVRRKTQFFDSGLLRAKVKSRADDVVTVANPPDDRRSNPLVRE